MGVYCVWGDWCPTTYRLSLALLHGAYSLLEKTDVDQDVSVSYTCGHIHRANFLVASKMGFFFITQQNLPSCMFVGSHDTGQQTKISIFYYFLLIFFSIPNLCKTVRKIIKTLQTIPITFMTWMIRLSARWLPLLYSDSPRSLCRFYTCVQLYFLLFVPLLRWCNLAIWPPGALFPATALRRCSVHVLNFTFSECLPTTVVCCIQVSVSSPKPHTQRCLLEETI